MLTPTEQHDFDHIVKSAKECGWLNDECGVTADVIGEHVIIRFSIGTHIQRYEYQRTDRWPYQFLRDLAEGVFKAFT